MYTTVQNADGPWQLPADDHVLDNYEESALGAGEGFTIPDLANVQFSILVAKERLPRLPFSGEK